MIAGKEGEKKWYLGEDVGSRREAGGGRLGQVQDGGCFFFVVVVQVAVVG